MLLQKHMDLSAVGQLFAAGYYFAEAYNKQDLYWAVQLAEGIAYMVPFMAYIQMSRYDT